MPKQKRIQVSKSRIVRYWYDYAVECYHKKEKMPLFAERLIIDVGEPNCWGCDTWFNEYDLQDSLAKWEMHFTRYNNMSRFHICHIVPHSLGGKDEPSNLVLMCADCHREAPDTTNRQAFLNWMNKRPELIRKKEIAEWKEACEMQGLPFEILYDTVFKAFNDEGFKDYYSKNTVYHFDTDRGAIFKKSTVIIAVMSYYKIEPVVSFNLT